MPHSASVCALGAVALVLGAHAAILEKITIQVVNSAKVNRATLARSEREAARAFENAGLDVEWRDCAAQPCTEDLGPGEFWLHVALWRPVSTGESTMGFTYQLTASDPTAPLAGAYYPMVREFAWNFGLDESVVLAPVLAHEIGHLLGLGHTLRGVMAPQFDLARIVAMSDSHSWFTRDQGAHMRSDLERVRLAAADGPKGPHGPPHTVSARSQD